MSNIQLRDLRLELDVTLTCPHCGRAVQNGELVVTAPVGQASAATKEDHMVAKKKNGKNLKTKSTKKNAAKMAKKNTKVNR